MALSGRLLPIEEWPRLTGALGTVWELIPKTSKVFVVERDGEIVSQWSAHLVVQYFLDGLETIPKERFNSAVARKMLLTMRANTNDLDASSLLTGADTDEIRTLLGTAGAVRQPMDLYAWPAE